MEALNACFVKEKQAFTAGGARPSQAYLRVYVTTAGRPALRGSEPGQVRKEAATAILCKCRGNGSPPSTLRTLDVASRSRERKTMKRKWIGAGVGLAMSCSAPAWAIDGVAVEGGNGDHVNRVQVA